MLKWSSSRRFTHLKWVSPVLLVTYLILTIGAEELHRFSCSPHHHTLAACSHHGKQFTTIGGLALSRAPQAGPQGDVHDANSCVLCQWIKYLPQGLPPKGASIILSPGEVGENLSKTPFQVLSLDKKLSRAPPAVSLFHII
jgi:hypothetical protein